MIKNICFNIIKFFIFFLKKFRAETFVFDRMIYCIGNVQITLNRNKYNEIEDLTETETKIFSQNGEDGIIDYLINRLKIDKKNFVEIGVGNYREANTRFLYNSHHPKGLIVDCIDDMEKKVKEHVNFWKGDLRVINKQIDTENILDVLNDGCNFEIDLFSIDIDSIDYWIIDKLKNNISKIFVAEYNPVFGSKLEVSVPNISGFKRGDYHYSHLCYGMSLRALVNLMDKKGYYFIGSNIQKINAFFISKEFKKNIFFKNIKIKSLDKYTDSNIRDSRDSKNNLNYLSDDLKFKEIENCEVVNLKNNKYELIKLKELK